MNDEINYKNNPLNGVGLKKMVTELSNHYGFDILFAYLNINCFGNNPSVASSVKFLKKTDWAREKVEGFYMYSFKSLPKASHQESQLPPRDRIVPDDQTAGEPAVLSLEDAGRLREDREARAADFDSNSSSHTGKNSDNKQRSERSNSRESNSSTGDREKPSSPPKRTASTADNPWGIVKD